MSTRVYMGQVEPLSDDEVAGICVSAGTKRDGDAWEPAGVDLSQFRRNPVILRDHNQLMVIGAAAAIGLTDDGSAIGIKIRFAPAGASEAADEARSLAKAGILRGISAGIIPHEWEGLNDGSFGRRIIASELLEVSLVAVGADSDALITARSLSARRSTLAMLRSLPLTSQSAQATVLERVRQPPPASTALLTPSALRAREAEISRTLTVFGLQQATSRDRDERHSREMLQARVDALLATKQ